MLEYAILHCKGRTNEQNVRHTILYNVLLLVVQAALEEQSMYVMGACLADGLADTDRTDLSQFSKLFFGELGKCAWSSAPS